MTLPKLPGPQPPPGQLPKLGPSTLPSLPGWVHVPPRLQILVAAGLGDTSSLGDMPMPPGYNHAMVIWRARDTSANTGGSFGGMNVAINGGAIDTGANYDWVDTGVNSVTPATTLSSGNATTGIDSFTTAGGGTAAQVWDKGIIWLPFYSAPDTKVYCHWQSAQDNITFGTGIIVRNGAGDYRFQGALTKLRFTSNAGSLASGTTFDLFVSQ